MLRKSTLLFFIILLSLYFFACKERNDDFPPVSWSTYYYDNTHPPVTSMLILNDHCEWFGLEGSGGVVYGNGITHEQYSADESSIPFDSVTSLLLDGNNVLWAGHKKGLAKFYDNQWEIIPQFQGLHVTSLAVKGIGELWVGFHGTSLSGGLAVKRENNWTFFTDAPSYLVNTLLADRFQQLWVGTEDKGLFKFDGNTWLSTTDDLSLDEPASITCLCNDPDGNVAAGTKDSQLIIFSDKDPLLLTTGTSKPIGNILYDTNGKLWIATSGAGLLTLEGSSWGSYNILNSKLPSDTIKAITRHPGHFITAAFPDGRLLNFPY
jgi:ligand-binding sensor domain-containing protein